MEKPDAKLSSIEKRSGRACPRQEAILAILSKCYLLLSDTVETGMRVIYNKIYKNCCH
jgi:hypothetical protein